MKLLTSKIAVTTSGIIASYLQGQKAWKCVLIINDVCSFTVHKCQVGQDSSVHLSLRVLESWPTWHLIVYSKAASGEYSLYCEYILTT